MKYHQTPVACAVALALLIGCSQQPVNQANQRTETESQPVTTQVEVQPVAKQIEKAAEMELLVAAEADVMRAKPQVARMAAYSGKMAVMPPGVEPSLMPEDRDNYIDTPSNGVQQVSNSPLSTFSIDVDTGSYANVRSYLNMGRKPPADAVREEGFINYFNYQYPAPESRAQPFSINTEIAPAPWAENRQLLRIGLQGYEIAKSERKPSNLVFLVDVSGSMNQPNKLPLLVRSLTMLTQELNANDSVSLVTYAGNASVVLKPTQGDDKQTIINALKQLRAGGGTSGESGIKLAYQQARQGFISQGVNRIILATDGDFNVGVTSIDKLKQLIAEERENGISLTTLGFGRGNYNDALMEQLANNGDGNHAYIDTLREGKKVLLHQMSGTLQTIASDVKIQIEFNPETVKEYRLIGYQNRLLRDEDFNNDKVDAGEIGAGHSVTALYELTLSGEKGQIDDLRYQQKADTANNLYAELAQVKVRYKLPGEESSVLTKAIINSRDIQPGFDQASSEFQFATAVAAFAQKLKDNRYLDGLSYAQIADIARKNRGIDPYNYRGEFISLVDIAQSL